MKSFSRTACVVAILIGLASATNSALGASTVIGPSQFFLDGNVDFMLGGEGPAPGTFPGPYSGPTGDLNFAISVAVDEGADTATFSFTNSSTGALSGVGIGQVYFQDQLFNPANGLLSLADTPTTNNTGSDGNLYLVPPVTPDAPGSNFPVDWVNGSNGTTIFDGTTGIGFDAGNADGGNKVNAGVQTGETWEVTFSTDSNLTLATLLSTLNTGPGGDHFNIAFHIKQVPTSFEGITGGPDSLWAVTWPVSAVPVPPAIWLFLSGLVGLGVMARRKREQAIA